MKRLLPALTLGLLLVTAQAQSDGFIFQPISCGHALPSTQPDNHASTLAELKNGDILTAWFGGTREGALDQAIYGARLHAVTWSAPVELARLDKLAVWNPVLFHPKDGRLWLYYKYGTHPSKWLKARKVSIDEGLTWSAEEHLPDGILGPIIDKPLVLPDGTIVSGSSVENGKWAAWVERSADNGATWTKFGPITLPDAADIPDDGAIAASAQVDKPTPEGIIHTKLYPPAKEVIGIIQPSVLSLGAHHLRFYARVHSEANRVAISDSTDDGRTFTQARLIALPNPNSGIDAVGLRDGRIVLNFNNSDNTRTPLNLAVSKVGEYFKIFKTLEDTAGQYSYPAIVQAANGDILTTYSWRRETIKFVRFPLADIPK